MLEIELDLPNYRPPSLNTFLRWHWSRRRGEKTKAMFNLICALECFLKSGEPASVTTTIVSEALRRASIAYVMQGSFRRTVHRTSPWKSSRKKRPVSSAKG